MSEPTPKYMAPVPSEPPQESPRTYAPPVIVTTTARPAWTLDENTSKLWAEDDCTTRDPDHETLARAWQRLFKSDFKVSRCLESWDAGDATYNLHHEGIVTVSSYPGNDEIRVLRTSCIPAARATTTQGATTREEVIDLTPFTRAPLAGDSFETFANFFIVAAIADSAGEMFRRVFGERDKVTGAKICLTINGVQVPFLETLRHFHGDWERVTREGAAELLEEKFSGLTGEIDDLGQRIREAITGKTK